jgi:hypothetical protein
MHILKQLSILLFTLQRRRVKTGGAASVDGDFSHVLHCVNGMRFFFCVPSNQSSEWVLVNLFVFFVAIFVYVESDMGLFGIKHKI